ncbi:MAG: DMT family transporter [Candidatus Kapaibacterium sp.]|nr:MAG: DMT family transporter [Candidatus Kapabacteria bacterium]
MERMISRPKAQAQAFIILGFLALVWGSSFILMKRALLSFPPFYVAAFRIMFAGIALAPFAWQYRKQFDRRLLKYYILAGVFGSALPALLFAIAQTHINSTTASLLNALAPLSALLLGAILFGVKPERNKIFGVMIGFAGAVLLVIAAHGDAATPSITWYALLLVAATLCYGFNANLVGRYLHTSPPLLTNSIALGTLALVYGVALLVFNLAPRADAVLPAWSSIAAHPLFWQSLGFLLVLSLIGTAFSNVLYVKLIQISSPIFATSVTYLIPIVAICWGLLDGEIITLLHTVGIVLILSGIFLVNRRSAKH